MITKTNITDLKKDTAYKCVNGPSDLILCQRTWKSLVEKTEQVYLGWRHETGSSVTMPENFFVQYPNAELTEL